ncbi:hypothetical protein RISK_006166 [Rhodopirellula islandica]|uniref:Uncharacterized protein n=1 Tax=Rhodopirellula islandica TaxID=595434 RepID=A0A0J1B5H9_RHOIS|nr:hypothetical protein RISK_006166 [Rhodopirellula islandica]
MTPADLLGVNRIPGGWIFNSFDLGWWFLVQRSLIWTIV